MPKIASTSIVANDETRRSRVIARSVVPVAPILVSQLNCEAAAGLKPRRFCELIIEYAIPCRKEGQLRLVTAEVLLTRLAAESIDADSNDGAAMSVDDEADRVLAALGRRRAR